MKYSPGLEKIGFNGHGDYHVPRDSMVIEIIEIRANPPFFSEKAAGHCNQ
jgi:hypothetical protein